jgi:hypothetical protein
MVEQLRGPFEKFVDSPYYSKSELGGGAVTVSFSNKVIGTYTIRREKVDGWQDYRPN